MKRKTDPCRSRRAEDLVGRYNGVYTNAFEGFRSYCRDQLLARADVAAQ